MASIVMTCTVVVFVYYAVLQVVPVDKPVVRSVKKTEVMQDIQKCKKLCCVCLFYIMFQFLSLVWRFSFTNFHTTLLYPRTKNNLKQGQKKWAFYTCAKSLLSCSSTMSSDN